MSRVPAITKRLNSALGNMSPAEFERQCQPLRAFFFHNSV